MIHHAQSLGIQVPSQKVLGPSKPTQQCLQSPSEKVPGSLGSCLSLVLWLSPKPWKVDLPSPFCSFEGGPGPPPGQAPSSERPGEPPVNAEHSVFVPSLIGLIRTVYIVLPHCYTIDSGFTNVQDASRCDLSL